MPLRRSLAALIVPAFLTACGGGSTTALPSGASATVPIVAGTAAATTAPSGGTAPVTGGSAPYGLAPLHIDRTKTAVAGISSGGFMAVQLDVAYSSTFRGAAIYAGGPFYCAQDSLATAIASCEEALPPPSDAALEAYTDQQAAAGTIDPTSGLSGEPVYLWSGTLDAVVNQQTMNALQSYYQHYGARVTYENTYAAGHGWESPYGTEPCPVTASPYMIDCSGYDSEQTWLTLLYGTLNPKNTGAAEGTLYPIDQTAFGSTAAMMDTTGYEYVPASCAQGATCKLVVALHGCNQTQAQIGTAFITESGIQPWADTNGIVVLFPYAIATASTGANPQGCWDWWGYTNASYALRAGPQMAVIKAMVDRIQGS